MSANISLELLKHNENEIVWNLNQLCNHRCTCSLLSTGSA
jgi:hypothetical protein